MSKRTVALIAAALVIAAATPSLALPGGGKLSPGFSGGGGFKAPGPGSVGKIKMAPGLGSGPKVPGPVLGGGPVKVPGGGFKPGFGGSGYGKPGYGYGAAAMAGGLAVGALAVGAASAGEGECWIERRRAVDDEGTVFVRRVRVCE